MTASKRRNIEQIQARQRRYHAIGLVCLCCVVLGCSSEAPIYIIDIDRLVDTDPETCDKRLKEMVSVRLIHEDKWEDQNVNAEPWLWGKVVFRRYELLAQPPDEFGDRTQIDIGFNHLERAHKFGVAFYEPIAREKALLRLGFDSKDFLKHPHLPDTWFVCIRDSVRIYFVQWVNSGGVPEVFVKHLE